MAAGDKTPGFPFIPRPRTLGVFVILVTALAFTAGWVRNELALSLLGAVFLAILAYCFFTCFFLGLLHRRKARLVSLGVTPETVNQGQEARLIVKTGGIKRRRFLRLPAILIRCELYIETKDGRVIRHYASPGAEDESGFPVKERGAYYGRRDSFVIFDAPGFFRLAFPVSRDAGLKLLALPAPAPELVSFSLKSGGDKQRNEPHYRKSDELTDHRPYIPGDDPRRINWKLYGHAPLGELFVREGEPEPPPRSRLLIQIDTEADRSLYTADEARKAVDLLAENALTAALELSGQGMDVLIGYTGGEIAGAGEGEGQLNAAELASALAKPAAVFWPAAAFSGDLPKAPHDRGVLVFALPRSSSETSALDRFLKNRESAKQNSGRETDIVFLYNRESARAVLLEESARVCVNLYNGKSGVHAGRAAVSPGSAAR